jgi:hypothetical protein
LPDHQSLHRNRQESYIYITLSGLLLLGVGALSLSTRSKHVLHTQGRLHSYFHMLAFTVIGYVTGRISRKPYQRILFFFLCLGFGFTTEVLEHLVYKNGLETHDIWVDAIGVLFGTGLALLAPRPMDEVLAAPRRSW